MVCYHPLKGFVLGVKENGKQDIKVCGYHVDHLEKHGSSLIPCFSSNRGSMADKCYREFIEIPCGRCVGCRLAYSRQWADRCLIESKYHLNNYFITLTYDDNNIPFSPHIDINGEVVYTPTLVKKDLQDFYKRLRYYIDGQKIMYYNCGEYGDRTGRPHYHCIIFGLELPDLEYYKQSTLHNIYYNSELVSKAWQNKGYCVVAPVTWETCAYTARYVMKKKYGLEANVYNDLNIQPEFTTMSLKPAIGRKYFDEHKDEIYTKEFINIATEKGGRKIRPPKYFDKLYDVCYPSDMEKIRQSRKFNAELATQLALEKTDLSYLDYLAVKEMNKLESLKTLVRKEF